MTNAQLFATAWRETHAADDLVSKMYRTPEGEQRDFVMRKDIDALFGHLSRASVAAFELQQRAYGAQPPRTGD